MPESQLRSLVIHELAHIRRDNFLANLLASVAMLLYWPNPLFCLRLQVLEYKIVACGDSALRLGCPKDWANHAYGVGDRSTADSTR